MLGIGEGDAVLDMLGDPALASTACAAFSCAKYAARNPPDPPPLEEDLEVEEIVRGRERRLPNSAGEGGMGELA